MSLYTKITLHNAQAGLVLSKAFGNLKKKQDSSQRRQFFNKNSRIWVENKTHVKKQCPSHQMEREKIESEIVKYDMIL